MPYAHNNQISQDPIEGGVAITDAQYNEAITGMCQGKVVSIDGGFSVAAPIVPEPEVPTPPTKEERIATLQAAYDSDLDKLKKFWLAALIADGVGETDRQAVIKGQMDEISAQLEIDILNIIMEE